MRGLQATAGDTLGYGSVTFYYFQSQPTTKETLTMARIPYADLTNPEAKPLVERIVAERGGVLHLYQMLLHSPPVASGWLNY